VRWFVVPTPVGVNRQIQPAGASFAELSPHPWG